MKSSELAGILRSRITDMFLRGSIVYGTYEEGVSDIDYLVVVDDSCDGILSDYPKGEFQFEVVNDYIDSKSDFTFVTQANFITSIRNNEIDRLECLFTKKSEYYDSMFILDKWKLRKSVSSICSNSWVKAKKKLIVDKDYNLRIAQKSLWHSLRIYMFGIQIAKYNTIKDFSEANYLWNEIKNEPDPIWDVYYAKYKPLFNKLHSELVELCERPKLDLQFT